MHATSERDIRIPDIDPAGASPIVCTVRVLLRSTVVLALALSLGLHWAFLQTVAWTGMLVRYAQQGSLSEAVSRTFGGENPCSLCKAVQEGRAAERQQDKQSARTQLKLDTLALCPAGLKLPTAPRAWVCGNNACFSPRADAPPKPPPKRGAFLPLNAA